MTSKPIVMYATATCPYCMAARNLLKARNLSWTEVSIDIEPDKRAEMMSRTGRRTVPQIFIGDRHIGGFDDLNALQRSGELEALLEG